MQPEPKVKTKTELTVSYLKRHNTIGTLVRKGGVDFVDTLIECLTKEKEAFILDVQAQKQKEIEKKERMNELLEKIKHH